MSTWYERPVNGQRTFSNGHLDNATTSSLILYGMLPSLVQRRLPKLRYLKRALSQFEEPSRHERVCSRDSIDSTTPPPSYRSNFDELDPSDDQAIALESPFAEMPPSRPSSSGSSTPALQPDTDGSGVQWRYADTGFSLLSLAQQEKNSFAHNWQFIRRQFIAGVACMMKALPSDLTLEEEVSLRQALPPSLAPTHRQDRGVMIRQGDRDEVNPFAAPVERRSFLHRWVAMVMVYVFIVAAAIIPYLRLFVRKAYQFDREHKLSDRLIAQGFVTADIVSRRTFAVASQVCAMNDGKVGESMKEIGMFIVQGVSGGMYEGVGEGMQVIGLRAGGEQQQRNADQHNGLRERPRPASSAF